MKGENNDENHIDRPGVLPVTPRELIADRQCTAACLTAVTPPDRCTDPRCQGALHGALAMADVSALIEARRSGVDLRTDLELVENAAA